jgi:hypothetical protein
VAIPKPGKKSEKRLKQSMNASTGLKDQYDGVPAGKPPLVY